MKAKTKTVGNVTCEQLLVVGYFVDGEPHVLYRDTRSAARAATRKKKNLVWAKCHAYSQAVLALSKRGSAWKRHNKESLVTG